MPEVTAHHGLTKLHVDDTGGDGGSELHLIAGGPHGCNPSHPEEFNEALIGFLAR